MTGEEVYKYYLLQCRKGVLLLERFDLYTDLLTGIVEKKHYSYYAEQLSFIYLKIITRVACSNQPELTYRDFNEFAKVAKNDFELDLALVFLECNPVFFIHWFSIYRDKHPTALDIEQVRVTLEILEKAVLLCEGALIKQIAIRADF